jgi:hypothetical protein
MNVLVVVALLGAVGYGVDNDWKVAKAYKSYENCRVDHPKVQNTMTSWQYDPCNLAAYKLQNK